MKIKIAVNYNTNPKTLSTWAQISNLIVEYDNSNKTSL